MKDDISVDKTYPFIGIESVIFSISDIQSLHTNIISRIDRGFVVSVPDDDTTLLHGMDTEDTSFITEGDELDIYYIEKNAYKDNGEYRLLHDILSKAKTGQIFNAKVIKIVDRGLLVTIDGLQCFMPNGQIGFEKRDDLQCILSSTIDVKLISVKLKENEENRFLPIVSHKIIEDEKNVILIQDKLQGLKVGSIIPGTVKRIVSYGVFVTLFPSVDGLIHITDLSWERVSNPSDILSVGQIINVIILDIKQSNDGKIKISLGLKQLSKKPWERFDRNTKVGEVVSGTICNITDYGIFIMLPSGVQGLVHRTELSWDPSVKSRNFQKEQLITAKIINIDWENERLLLSVKQMSADPWDNIMDKIAVGKTIETTIKSFTNLGILVTITDGIEGLIHVSELSWTEIIKKPSDYYSLGDHLNAVIVSIDQDKRQIKLSHKLALPNPWQNYAVGQHVNVIILEKKKHGIQVIFEKEGLPAFIPEKFVPMDCVVEENGILECLIQEIDESKGIINLAIV